jgi:import inner membrane translocase subunit TIM16
MQILDVKALDKEEVEKRFKHLFEINEKEKGGTLYIQSKVSWSFSCFLIHGFF